MKTKISEEMEYIYDSEGFTEEQNKKYVEFVLSSEENFKLWCKNMEQWFKMINPVQTGKPGFGYLVDRKRN